jgi:hypothetical protein
MASNDEEFNNWVAVAKRARRVGNYPLLHEALARQRARQEEVGMQSDGSAFAPPDDRQQLFRVPTPVRVKTEPKEEQDFKPPARKRKVEQDFQPQPAPETETGDEEDNAALEPEPEPEPIPPPTESPEAQSLNEGYVGSALQAIQDLLGLKDINATEQGLVQLISGDGRPIHVKMDELVQLLLELNRPGIFTSVALPDRLQKVLLSLAELNPGFNRQRDKLRDAMVRSGQIDDECIERGVNAMLSTGLGTAVQEAIKPGKKAMREKALADRINQMNAAERAETDNGSRAGESNSA